MLVFNENDIFKAADPDEVLAAVEKAMLIYETDDYLMPPRSHVYHRDNTLLLMPCFNNRGFGTKLVSVFPNNALEGEPVINGIMVLNEGRTGKPLALLNGQALTAIRTGAVGGVSIKHLAKPDSKTLGLIGTGVQGFYQAIFGARASNIERIIVFSRTASKGKAFINRLADHLPRIRLVLAGTMEELLEHSDIVITATTAVDPVLPDDGALLKGKHFVGIGSFKPEMREYPKALYGLLKQVFVDTNYAKIETGDLALPLKENWLRDEQVITLGKWLKAVDRQELGDTTFFKSVGMALFDLMTAQLIYQKGLELGLGQKINL
ncbi:MAG: ornithine cyclodeaminase family protein [Bacillota bacterium]